MEFEKGIVCVTGGTGFVASWLIMRLLQHGYTVRTTVRFDPEHKRDISYLKNLEGASERLHIFNAELDTPDSFNEAIEGCMGVFHVAHPLDIMGKEPEETVVHRAIQGTLGILRACVSSKTVKRVVYTSSAAAALFSGNGEDIVDESSWSNIDFYRSLNLMGTSYVAAKTRTERAALEFADKYGLDLVRLVPSLVVGPFICPVFPSSVYTAMSMILGDRRWYKSLIKSNMVHIDDVASAHIFLLEYPNAKGRYICSSDEVSLLEMSEFLSAKYPDFQIPSRDSLKDVEGYKVSSLSSMKLLNSGFKFKCGLSEMFDGAIRSCREKGFLKMK